MQGLLRPIKPKWSEDKLVLSLKTQQLHRGTLAKLRLRMPRPAFTPLALIAENISCHCRALWISRNPSMEPTVCAETTFQKRIWPDKQLAAKRSLPRGSKETQRTSNGKKWRGILMSRDNALVLVKHVYTSKCGATNFEHQTGPTLCLETMLCIVCYGGTCSTLQIVFLCGPTFVLVHLVWHVQKMAFKCKKKIFQTWRANHRGTNHHDSYILLSVTFAFHPPFFTFTHQAKERAQASLHPRSTWRTLQGLCCSAAGTRIEIPNVPHSRWDTEIIWAISWIKTKLVSTLLS